MSSIIYKAPFLFALVDCNNFYVSCERAFNPYLENKPVVVLSNNDGCIISRSNEAKKLGIPMGAPYFKWKYFCAQHQVKIFSSNYELYGDMSRRVMDILKQFSVETEIYSIDEAFLRLPIMVEHTELAALRLQVKRQTGIPISIGIAKTKTLAKMANQLAKNNSVGVFSLVEKEKYQHYFATFPVQKIWGVGDRLAEKLNALGLDTAGKLYKADAKMIRHHFSVTLEKTIQELQDIPCIELEYSPQRKQIISSRSFGKLVTELEDLEEAISYYTQIAALKLRKQRCVTSALYVFLQTNIFREKKPQYGNCMMFPFPVPTADARYLVRIAKKCVKKIYRQGYQYHKAGVMLLDISPQTVKQYDLLLDVDDTKSEQLMSAMDNINKRMGKNTIFLAAEGIQRDWMIKCEKRSPRYTTRWGELLKVTCS